MSNRDPVGNTAARVRRLALGLALPLGLFTCALVGSGALPARTPAPPDQGEGSLAATAVPTGPPAAPQNDGRPQ
jgi:hypothetical protein